MISPELDGLIVDYLADIDSAAKRLVALEKEVFGALGQIAKDWARGQDWRGKFDYLNDEFWLAPPEWRTPGSDSDDEWMAWFALELGAGDTDSCKVEEDRFYLTRLCQVGSGSFGFRFQQEVTSKSRWRKMIRGRSDEVAKTAFIVDAAPSFFLPVRCDTKELAAALREGTIVEGLKQVEVALRCLIDARPTFDAVITAAKNAEA